MSTQTIMALAVGLGGLMISALTLILNHIERIKGRTNTFRDALYKKQVDAIVDIFKNMHTASITMAGLEAAVRTDDKDTIKKLGEACVEQHNNLFLVLGAYSCILPNDIMNPLTLLIRNWENLIDISEGSEKEKTERIALECRRLEVETIVVTRKIIGTDRLSKETKAMLEEGPTEQYEKIIKIALEAAAKVSLIH